MKRTFASLAFVALAAFTSTMAHGQYYDLDEQTDPFYTVPYLTAVETFSTDNDKSITVDGETYYEITSPVSLQGSIGVRGEADSGRTLFLRYDLENAVFFNGSHVADGFTTQTTRWIVGQGELLPGEFPTLEAGGHGQNYIVESTFPVSGGAGFTQDQIIGFDLTGIAILPEKPVSLTYTVYLGLGDALQGRNPVVTKKADNIINSGRAFRHDAAQATVSTTITSGFTQLANPFADGSHWLGSLFTYIFPADRGADSGGAFRHAHPPTNTFIVRRLSEIAKIGDRGSTITLRGDFSIGNFTASTSWDTSLPERPLITRENGKVLEKVTIAAPDSIPVWLSTFFQLYVFPPADNTTPIPEGDYTIAVDYEGLPNRAFPPLDLAETVIGRIRREGTRVQIPYLTTFSGYRQKVVIVNRSTRPVSYTFKFVAEDGVTATPGAMAEGVVPAQDRAVLKAADIVSLEGKTRTAATLIMAAENGTVDVATTTVNMEDKGTDTVVLEPRFTIFDVPPLPATPPSALQPKRR